MSEGDLRQRLAAILVADVVGYSRLMAADERGTLESLKASMAALRASIATHGGRVFATGGDSLLAIFDTGRGAVTAALEAQRALEAMAADVAEGRRIRFRMGVHLGDVFERDDGDVYGDGVNVAARLEGLAETGGILVSDAVRATLQGLPGVRFDDRGRQAVKNIPQPVHAYAVRFAATPAREGGHSGRRFRVPIAAVLATAAAVVAALAVIAVWQASMRGERPADAALHPASGGGSAVIGASGPTLPARPSIAVLPFDNLSGEPQQAYFADGITDDLITDLSKVAGLFVIGRNSAFAYRGRTHDVREVARALGVRYVLEGSVRRSGDDLRVNVQLVDATTGGRVWADRYDGDLRNVFALQDRIARSVVSALSVELTTEDRDRVARRGSGDARAYDAFLRGWQHYQRQTPDDFVAAIDRLHEAIAIDAKYSRAHAALAAVYWEAYTRYWGTAMGLATPHTLPAQAEAHLAKALADPTPLAHQVASAMLLQQQRHAEALAEAERAVASDPNDPDGQIAMARVLSFVGRPDEALAYVERAMRQNPHFPPGYLYQRGLAQFVAGRLDEASGALEKALAGNAEDHWSQRLLLSTYGLFDRREAAGRLLNDIRNRERRGRSANYDPLTVSAIAFWYPFAKAADAARFGKGLRAAGVPD